MYYASLLLLVLALLLSGCQENLNPSGEDKRPAVDTSLVGHQVGQIAPDFTLESTLLGTTESHYTLYTETASYDAVVFYFTMWCPVCDEHMSDIRARYVSNYPNVRFLLVDYVNSSVADARTSQQGAGYADMVTLADTANLAENLYDGTMGTTVVVSAANRVLMNQDYSDGRKLGQVLRDLP